MSDLAAASEAIKEFVGLATERRRKTLSVDARDRLETLDEMLRDAIDGARPAPKRIANPVAVRPGQIASSAKVTRSAPQGAASSAMPAAKQTPAAFAAGLVEEETDAGEQPTKMSGALDQVMGMNARDKKKVSEIDLADLPESFYTPPMIPAFMADYYSDDLVPMRSGMGSLPTRVVSSDGESVELPRETKVLLGLEKPAPAGSTPPAASGRPGARGAAAAAAAKAPEIGTPVIVHLVAGGTRRGAVEDFDPESSAIDLVDGASVEMKDVLAIFFGLKKGVPASPAAGQAVTVKLINDKQVTGLTADYAEGAASLTVVPEPRRGNIDRIWVPAWAVKGIEM